MTRDKALSILGLDLNATPADIKSAYRRLARANHPDKMGSAELFKLVQEAYETLEANVKVDANRTAESGREKTAHTEPRSKAEADRAEVERREARRKAAERISKLQGKIVEATEAKRKAEEKYSEAIEADRNVQMGGNDRHDLISKTMKTLHAAVETEAELRVELIRERHDIRGNIWMDVTERPDIAREVIAAEWDSMPNKHVRNEDWCYDAFAKAMIAMHGIPYDDKDRIKVILAMTEMFGDGMAQDLIHERIKLTHQDFRAGGFFIWARRFLWLGGYHKLAVNHLGSALRIKPRLWSIYEVRGLVNIDLGNYVEAIDDFLAGIECVSMHNRGAMHALRLGIKTARERANASLQSS